jgi:hypothetical protein
VGEVAPDLPAQERADVDDLSAEAVLREGCFHAQDAKQVPVVFVNRAEDVFRDFVHAEKTEAKAPTCDAAHFRNGSLQTVGRKMFEQIVNEEQIERFVRGWNIEHITNFERSGGE